MRIYVKNPVDTFDDDEFYDAQDVILYTRTADSISITLEIPTDFNLEEFLKNKGISGITSCLIYFTTPDPKENKISGKSNFIFSPNLGITQTKFYMDGARLVGMALQSDKSPGTYHFPSINAPFNLIATSDQQISLTNNLFDPSKDLSAINFFGFSINPTEPNFFGRVSGIFPVTEEMLAQAPYVDSRALINPNTTIGIYPNGNGFRTITLLSEPQEGLNEGQFPRVSMFNYTQGGALIPGSEQIIFGVNNTGPSEFPASDPRFHNVPQNGPALQAGEKFEISNMAAELLPNGDIMFAITDNRYTLQPSGT